MIDLSLNKNFHNFEIPKINKKTPASKLLKITDAEWQAAEEYFNNPNNANKTKLAKKKGSSTGHSFIKIPSNDPKQFHIIAMANYHCTGEEEHARLGQGAFCKVKMGQNREGKNFAVKVEKRGLRGEHHIETKISKLLGILIGEAERVIDIHYNTKLYTVVQLIEGEELKDHIYLKNTKDHKRSYKLTLLQRYITALKCCKEVQKLHDLGIIHGDLKPANFKAVINGNQIEVKVLDFGFSLMLEPGQKIVKSEPNGTAFYMAPETEPIIKGERSERRISKKPVSFSFASDIFALGKMFEYDLQLPKEIFSGMLNYVPHSRDNMSMVMNKIYSNLINGLLEKYSTYDRIKEEYNSYGTVWEIANDAIKGTNHLEIMKKIAKQMGDLRYNTVMSLDDKAKYALTYISSVLSDIKKEDKIFEFESSIEKWCNNSISEITGVVEDEKISGWVIAANSPKHSRSGTGDRGPDLVHSNVFLAQ